MAQPTQAAQSDMAAGAAQPTAPMHQQPISVMRRSITARGAIQWTGDNLIQVQHFCLPQSPMTHGEKDLAVQVLDRLSMKKYPSLGRQLTMKFVERGGWLLRGPDDELTVWTAEEFAEQWAACAAALEPAAGPLVPPPVATHEDRWLRFNQEDAADARQAAVDVDPRD